eukprot:CAMPEP_0201910044 /NCGR_PEP_ID=MMETSP0903-20130614/1566_1 /ASSEMBLY_ACC=CAM_ASM_000552 /TAXON_ID=420261 /ORGANISM="Thalassiosira antarctica, Strain CCMP982" /LENGTH=597 /DNA_ID=CAMNT_0048444633 /DNA_START=61 /DNA_END=1854 /DNA_ORIENTATION=-
MDKLNIANQRLRTALGSYAKECEAQTRELDNDQSRLMERLNSLNRKELETFQAYGNADAADVDVVEVNAGGKIIAARRATLTQLKGSRLEALFNGRWDKKLQRDSSGRIFLDVNPMGFEAIVDYLNEMSISSEDNPPDLPSVGEEHRHVLGHQLELFGLCNIVRKDHFTVLHDWLKEDGSDGELSLLYRRSRDGLTAEEFHSKCDDKGCTITAIETTEGHVIGGYSNTSWTKGNGYRVANKAFLFTLSRNGISCPFKMKLKNSNDTHGIYFQPSFGPVFGKGHDLKVKGSKVTLHHGSTASYECHSSWPLRNGYGSYTIKEMKVFQVTEKSPQVSITTTQENFSTEINDAINAKWASLQETEAEILALENSFKDKEDFTSFFASGQPEDVVSLNVRGSIMMTRRQTLQLYRESALAFKFSRKEQQEQSPDHKIAKKWNYEDVVAWLNQLEGISESVVKEFEDNQVTGRELLALDAEGLKDFGISRKGLIYLLLDEIKKLKKASNDSVTLIEHSPYCFEKILDHLRLEGYFMQGLVETKPELPVVRDDEKRRYQKVVHHLFPGESSKIFQGDCGSDTQIIDDFGGSSNDGNSVDYESV